MTPEQFLAARTELRWSVRQIARELEISEKIPLQWEHGRRPIPEDIAVWLSGRAAASAAWPAPKRPWR